eukprot:2941922-Prymnesium_polylepis.1
MAGALPTYGWLTLLAACAAASWLCVSRCKLIVGFSGRLGTTAFVACNFAVLMCCAAGDAPWDVYYKSSKWDELTAESVLVSATFVTLSAVLTRAASNSVGLFPNLANPVSAGSAVALCLMLVIDVTDYRYKAAVQGAIGQGSFTGMASTQRLSASGVLAAGLIGGGLNAALHPFFLGFGGKQGFTAFLSCLPVLLLQASWKIARDRRVNVES